MIRTNRFFNFLNLIGLCVISTEPGTNLANLLELFRNFHAKTDSDERMFILLRKIANETWKAIYEQEYEEEFFFVHYCKMKVPISALDPIVGEFVNNEAFCCLFRHNLFLSAHDTEDEVFIRQYQLGYPVEEMNTVWLDHLDLMRHTQAVAEI